MGVDLSAVPKVMRKLFLKVSSALLSDKDGNTSSYHSLLVKNLPICRFGKCFGNRLSAIEQKIKLCAVEHGKVESLMKMWFWIWIIKYFSAKVFYLCWNCN